MNLNIDKQSPVLVTGATGYLAGVIIRRLLEEGVTVHAALRDPSKQNKIAHLQEMASKHKGEIKFFASDLLENGSYEKAMAGCSIVFHTASPFTAAVEDPQTELVDPAVKGTRNVLTTATNTKSVKRVVLTSSCAAIYGDAADAENAPGGILTEEIWNTTSSLQHQAYSYSKLLAEKEAWKVYEEQNQWKLVVINPSFIMGAGERAHMESTSFNIIKQMGDGTMKSGAPAFGVGMVDVRDVAEAHIRAAYIPGAQGRHILSGHNTNFFEATQVLRKIYGDVYAFPKSKMPKFLVWLLGPIFDKTITRKIVSLNVNRIWRADNSKSIKELGIEYKSLEETLKSGFDQVIASGAVQRKKG